MSSIYVLEPPTKGKVVMNTTMGPIDIELWPKEAPKAVRNFVQLAMEGYYDNTIFHRIIKSFLVQGGDPTGTGTGGESIYGGTFADEFHSRLRFNHRGLVACANAGSSHTNGSQFFISLDRCDWLDRKNTIFGKVTGDSIFNLLRIGDIETDENDRPIDSPPRIISFEILWNPFDDIIPRRVPGKVLPTVADSSGKENKKTVKKLNLLSFGEEAEEEEKGLAAVKEKIKSSHDVLNDPRLLKGEPTDQKQDLLEQEQTKQIQKSVREALVSHKTNPQSEDVESLDSHDQSDDDEMKFDERMRLQILRKQRELGVINVPKKSKNEKQSIKESKPSSPWNADESEKTKKEKLKLKEKGMGSEARAELVEKAYGDLQLLNAAERERHLQVQKKRRLQGRTEDVLGRLEKFRSSFLSSEPVAAVGASSRASGSDEDDDVSGWQSNLLKFEPDLSNKDGMARKDDPDAYYVEDPLLQQGKEKFNKMQAKLKRREREWAGKSLT
ncbi:peptidyl-prolyl cis-trans isomerase CYP57 isoform X2 [Nymphaea colorata]|nr:peptidyl-prolyl cis-trans isomerase CYP57 isoform X2 [Nymphaea colorata]